MQNYRSLPAELLHNNGKHVQNSHIVEIWCEVKNSRKGDCLLVEILRINRRSVEWARAVRRRIDGRVFVQMCQVSINLEHLELSQRYG